MSNKRICHVDEALCGQAWQLLAKLNACGERLSDAGINLDWSVCIHIMSVQACNMHVSG